MKELYKALLAAQQELEGVVKNAENPFHKNFYADLKAVIETVKPVFNKHGILIFQTNDSHAGVGAITVLTQLIHAETGEFVDSSLTLPLKDNTPQAAGSALTYARRYALATITGLYQEDDDGNAASVGSKPKQKAAQPAGTISPKQALRNIFAAGKPDGSQYQITEFQRLIGLNSIDKSTEEQCAEALQRYYAIEQGASRVK